MLITEHEILVPPTSNHTGLLEHLQHSTLQALDSEDIPVRLAVTRTSPEGYECELGVLSSPTNRGACARDAIFKFRRRTFENTTHFNAALVVPTGVGAELGGHSGDAGPLARLVGSACDKLITHPNVVNAADINEIPENGLYVEGSVLSRLLMGAIGLQEVRANRLLMILDEHTESFIHELSINAVSAARAALGLECPLVTVLKDRALLRAFYMESGRAAGRIEHFDRLCDVLDEYAGTYDAVALSTLINVPEHFHSDYFLPEHVDMVNPWGGVEAMLTHSLSLLYNVPTAHAPLMSSKEVMDLDVGIVDPRKSAEAISNTYLHCILKGLRNSPRIINEPTFGIAGVLTASDVSCLVIPDGCVGLPTLAALEQGIPVIAVKENANRMRNRLEDLPFAPGKLFIVENYLEAVGVMAALRAGVALDSVRRPIKETKIEYRRSQSDIPGAVPGKGQAATATDHA